MHWSECLAAACTEGRGSKDTEKGAPSCVESSGQVTGELKLEGDLQTSGHRAVSWSLCHADGLQGEMSIENYQQLWSRSGEDGCQLTGWKWSRGCSLEAKRDQSWESSSAPEDGWDHQDWEWCGGDSETGLASAPGIRGGDWARDTPERKEAFLKTGEAGHLVSGTDSRGRRQKQGPRGWLGAGQRGTRSCGRGGGGQVGGGVQLRGPGSMEVPTGSVRTGEAGGLEALRQLSWRPPRRQLHQTPIARGSLHWLVTSHSI